MNTNFFNSKTIGKSLKEVAVDLIHTSQDDIVSRWYHSDHSTDLFTWVDRGMNVIKQQLCFSGQVVEWNCLEGLRTGMVIEADLEDAPKGTAEDKIPKSESIKFDSLPHKKSIEMALAILDSTDLDENIRYQLLENFRSPQDIKTLPPDEFVKRFGMSLKNYQTHDAGFWESLKKTFHNIFKKSA